MMLDSVRTEVLHDATPTHERRLALGLRPKPHLFFSKRFINSLSLRRTNLLRLLVLLNNQLYHIIIGSIFLIPVNKVLQSNAVEIIVYNLI